MCVCISLSCVVPCVGRGLGAGLILRPRSPTKCLKGSISKKKNPTPEKGIRKKKKKKKKKKKNNNLNLMFLLRQLVLTLFKEGSLIVR
jgi:hypothetical protein